MRPQELMVIAALTAVTIRGGGVPSRPWELEDLHLRFDGKCRCLSTRGDPPRWRAVHRWRAWWAKQQRPASRQTSRGKWKNF